MKVDEEKFPVGMRVLVVDDDPTCLKLMEGLLLKCQYHVTTTSQGKEALRILKKNRNMFDIVISDVCMPGIDGFKLLQIMALEVDIPVIMLSAYGEPKLVMTGIKYGACDYLLKPVRIQELQNIWQHVVRKNKSIMSRRPSSTPDAGGRALPPTNNNAIQEGKTNETISENREKRGGDDNDGNETDENVHGDEQEPSEPTTQKKPRLFWSVELHQKFVDAVNQLGLDKAFPKKILDLMNVEGLTREKVASHLQKYRMYLRKINSASSQPSNSRVGSLGDHDVHIGSLGGGYGVFRSLSGSGNFLSATTSSSLSHQPGSMLGRFNPTMRGLSTSSTMFQRSHNLNPTNTLTPFGKFEPLGLQGCMNSGLFQCNNNVMMNGTNNVNSSNIGIVQSFGSPPPLPPPLEIDPIDYFCGISSCLDDSRGNMQNQGGLNNGVVNTNSFTNLGYLQNWQENHKPDNFVINSSLITAGGMSDQCLTSPLNQLEGVVSSHVIQQQNGTEKCNGDLSLRFDENELLEDSNPFGASSQNSSEYLEDIVGRFLKQGSGEMEQTQDNVDLQSFGDF